MIEWLNVNRLSLNIDKTNFMIFRPKGEKESCPTIHINGSSIQEVDDAKFLGIIIHNKLNWIEHIKCISRKIAKGTGIYIIITKNICYLLWNRGFCRSLNNTYPIFLTPCIRCTNHLCDSCDLTDVNPHFIPSLLRKIQNVDLLWRHRY